MWTTCRLREMEQATVEIAERRASENAAPISEASLKQARREIGREIHGASPVRPIYARVASRFVVLAIAPHKKSFDRAVSDARSRLDRHH
jgi:hypothetical protein